ncbi:CobW family GTP-binding protein [Sagittula stellata]|uniref:Putative GTPase n=1 Tax=Sagittula stellata (strain ATCC 700073 / DSM 11524 / E-37) TaxID=388399 RepID=A3K4S0_SAGS3|nr:GTP-binding protein [Sagittula stellata]EBA07969.1 Putative GTPase [Sagittula stellata E-37]
MDDRIPITVLTGFLGAGKTTVLNHLIRDPDAGRIAVVMNEFGDAGLDHDLIEEAVEETVLMQSGCICCTMRGDLLRTLGKLMARRQRGDLDFDRVVIETTGIADPGPILHSLIMDRIVGPHYRMDGIVTLVDAANGLNTLDRQFEAVQQVAMADLIVLSKVDLVAASALARLDARLADMNPSAKRMRAEHGRMPVGALFGVTAMRLGVSSDDVGQWLGQPDPLAGLSGFSADPNTTDRAPAVLPTVGAMPASADHRIVSVSFEIDGPIAAEVFDLWLDTLIGLRGPNILRIKGIVHLKGLEFPFVFHGVQHIFDEPVPLKNSSGMDTRCRVVVIARDMSEADLRASLSMLKMHPKDMPAAPSDPDLIHSGEMPF